MQQRFSVALGLPGLLDLWEKRREQGEVVARNCICGSVVSACYMLRCEGKVVHIGVEHEATE